MSIHPDKPWTTIKRKDAREMRLRDIACAGLRPTKLMSVFLGALGLMTWGMVAATANWYNTYTHKMESYTVMRAVFLIFIATCLLYTIYQCGRDWLIAKKYPDLSPTGMIWLSTSNLWDSELTHPDKRLSVKVFPDTTLQIGNLADVYQTFCSLDKVIRNDAQTLLADHLIPLTSELNRLRKLGMVTVSYEGNKQQFYFDDQIREAVIAKTYCRLKYEQLYQFVEPYFDADYARLDAIAADKALVLDQKALDSSAGMQAARDHETARLAGMLEVEWLVGNVPLVDHTRPEIS